MKKTRAYVAETIQDYFHHGVDAVTKTIKKLANS